MEAVWTSIMDYLAKYGLQILAAIAIFLIGRWLAAVLASLVEKTMIKEKIAKTLASFAKHLVQIGILVFVAIAVSHRLGIETAQFAVVIGAAGLAIGLALQGSLANFAAGRPLI